MRRRRNGGALLLSVIVGIGAGVLPPIAVETGSAAVPTLEVSPASVSARREHQPVGGAALVLAERRIKRAQRPHDAVKVGAPVGQHPLALFQPFDHADSAAIFVGSAAVVAPVLVAIRGVPVTSAASVLVAQHIGECHPDRFLRRGDPQLRVEKCEAPFETVFAVAATGSCVVLAAILAIAGAVILLILPIRCAILRLWIGG